MTKQEIIDSMVPEFIAALKDVDIYNRVLELTARYYKHCIASKDEDNFKIDDLLVCFFWSGTAEGEKYWSRMQDKIVMGREN